jgi:hypothetical protein
MLLSRVYVMKFEVFQEWFMLLSRVYVMKFEVCQECFMLLPMFMQWSLRCVSRVLPMGTNCAPLLADLFLYSYESEFLQKLVKDKKIHEARSFNFTYM